nr:hypothetical protein [Nonlabens ulvanivorans]
MSIDKAFAPFALATALIAFSWFSFRETLNMKLCAHMEFSLTHSRLFVEMRFRLIVEEFQIVYVFYKSILVVTQ